MKSIFFSSLIFSSVVSAGPIPVPCDISVPVIVKDPPFINRGYDSRSQNWRGYCINGLPQAIIDNSNGSLDMRMDSSQDDAASSLGVQAGGRYRTGVTEFSASAEFARSTVQNGYTVNFVYKFDTGYTEHFDSNSIITPTKGFEQMLGNSRNFFLACGDEYVSSVSRAARLLVNLSVTFASKEEASSFAAEFKMNSPSVGVNAAIQTAASNVSKKTTMKFYSVQMGGVTGLAGKAICPDDIADAKNNSGQTPKTSSATTRKNCAEPVIQCGFGKFDQCIQLLEGVVAYSANDFSNQITDEKGGPKNYAVTGVHVQPYLYAGAQFPLPPDEKTERAFQQELQGISAEFEKAFNVWVFAQKVTFAGTPRLSARQSSKMIEIEGRLHGIVNHLSKDIEGCYNNGYEACAASNSKAQVYVAGEITSMQAALGKELDGVGTLDQMNAVINTLSQPEAFAQYCDLATDNYPSIKTTVEGMKRWAFSREGIKSTPASNGPSDAETSASPGAASAGAPGNAKATTNKFERGDLCANLETYFEGIDTLDLKITGDSATDQRISSLAPIAALTHLKSLSLKGQGVGDISPLMSLEKLTNLNLDHNLIENVCKISGLKNLTDLNIANNRLQSIDCLSQSPSLKALDARGNSNGLVCPMKDISACRVQDFSKTVSTAELVTNCGVHVGADSVSLDSDHVLVVGGATPKDENQAKNSIDIYDRDSCRSTGARLQIERMNLTLTPTKKGILVVGGGTASLEMIDPVTFRSRLLGAKLKTARAFHTSTLLADGRVLIVGGYTDSLIMQNLRSNNIAATFEVFNPDTETIEETGMLSAPRAEHTATLLDDGRVLITGGYQDDEALPTSEIIDLRNHSVRLLKGRMLKGRFAHTAVRLEGGNVLVIGGVSWESKAATNGEVQLSLAGLSSLEVFDPKTETFRLLTDSLTEGRGLIRVQKMSDGRILLIGGNKEGRLFDTEAASTANDADRQAIWETASDTIEIFDPKTAGIYLIGSLSQLRSQATLAPIGTDSLLVIGGMGSNLSLISANLLVYQTR